VSFIVVLTAFAKTSACKIGAFTASFKFDCNPNKAAPVNFC
jgi:hypothetical protein